MALYDNYGSGAQGHAMCRGNPGNSVSMPGGHVTQTLVVPRGATAVDRLLVQIDPDLRVNAHLTLTVNGSVRVSSDAAANGDTMFSVGRVGLAGGDTVQVTIGFSSSYGKIITVYTVGNPGGSVSIRNSCPDGAQNFDSAGTGLRMKVYGWGTS